MNIAKHNGYPIQYINDMIRKQAIKNRLPIRNAEDALTTHRPKTKWITFTYQSPLICKVTNLFRNTQIQIAFKATNTIQQLWQIGGITGTLAAYMKSHATHANRNMCVNREGT